MTPYTYNRFACFIGIVLLLITGAFSQTATDAAPVNPDTTVAVTDSTASGIDTTAPVVDTTASVPDTTASANLAVVIDGIIIIKETGAAPLPSDSVNVTVGTTAVSLTADGEFSVITAPAAFYVINVTSPAFADVKQTITHSADKTNYFATIVLEKRAPSIAPDTAVPVYTSKIAWTLSGTIIDSRFETALKEPIVNLSLDDTPVTVSKQCNFQVSTFSSGQHTFHLSIPGYHPVSQTIMLTEQEKQLYIVIPTTILGEVITRREITVSAAALPLHRTAEPTKIEISRKELLRSTATMNDPIRALQTLPGVTAESDVAARPIVRGGDELESRVFLDGIPLMQPYHFGGVRSTFNQSALSSFTLYKSGFPADMHNAQSAIIEAHSRIPSDEKLSLEADVNYMQYCVYMGIPLFGGKAGINASSQGSYFDAVSKAAYKLTTNPNDPNVNQHWAELNTMPDYRDYAVGFSFTPSPKLKIFINEMYNTDRTRFSEIDSSYTVTYNYYKPLPGEEFPVDTAITRTYYFPLNDDTSKIYEVFYDGYSNNGRYDDGFPTYGEPYPSSSKPITNKNDSLIDITFYFRKPSPGQPMVVDTSVTITKSANPYDNAQSNTLYVQPIAGTYSDGKLIKSKTNYTIDTLMEYRSHYNILTGTAQYLPADDHIVNLSLAWQSRGWDLDFPTVKGAFGKSVYDVKLNQYNAHLGWIYSGRENHTFKAGGQLDVTSALYDVYLVRFLHEIIKSGSTNLSDFWGPINGDTALTFIDGNDLLLGSDTTFSLMERLLVSYKGERLYYNAGFYAQDAWEITPKLQCNLGIRAEYSKTDHETWLSPRFSLRYTLNDNHEITGTGGLYTQNNYDISAIALSEDLKPEKVWHAGSGVTSRLLPWLEQTVDIYGKYYYDLLSEVITPIGSLSIADLLEMYSNSNLQNIDPEQFPTDEEYQAYLMTQIFRNNTYSSSYVNDGRGYAFGIDYMLRFNPFDFWHGWISASWGRSFRERRPGWRVHPFPLERPLLFSIQNYYRLPRKYEIGVKYRYCSGIPYTSTSLNNSVFFSDNSIAFDQASSAMRIGNFNDSRYMAYQRLDLRFSKGFTFKGGKGHFYTEIWNSMNAPNLFAIDRKTRKVIGLFTNLPITIPFVGIDYTF